MRLDFIISVSTLLSLRGAKSSYPSPPLLFGLWYLFTFPGLRKALQESVVLPGKQGFKLQIEYFLNYISLQPTKSIPQ